VIGEPRSIDAPGGWQLDTANDNARTFDTLTSGSTVEMTFFPRPLSPDLLRAALGGPNIAADPFWVTNSMALAGFAGNTYSLPKINYSLAPQMQLPEAEKDFLIETAHNIVGDFATYYEAAVILQNYFRNLANFTYNTQPPPPNSGYLVRDFMESREGYCVHFATAMVMLSRAIGIPARMAVGFQPGFRDDAGSWVVTERDTHAWAELFFGPQVGWVAFEPTPASVSGSAPTYTITSTVDGYLPTDYEVDYLEFWNVGAASHPSVPGAPEVPQLAESGIPEFVETHRSGVGVGITALVVIAGLMAIWYAKQRRNRVFDDEFALSKATQSLAKRGIAIHAATTPRQLPNLVAASWADKYQSPPPSNLISGMQVIANSVEKTRYRGVENSLDGEDLRAALKQVTKARPIRPAKAN